MRSYFLPAALLLQTWWTHSLPTHPIPEATLPEPSVIASQVVSDIQDAFEAQQSQSEMMDPLQIVALKAFPLGGNVASWDSLAESPSMQEELINGIFKGVLNVIMARVPQDADVQAVLKNFNALAILSFAKQFRNLAKETCQQFQDLLQKNLTLLQIESLKKEGSSCYSLENAYASQIIPGIRTYAAETIILYRALSRFTSHLNLPASPQPKPISTQCAVVEKAWSTTIQTSVYLSTTPIRLFDYYVDQLNTLPTLESMYAKVNSTYRLVLWPTFPLWYSYGLSLPATWKLLREDFVRLTNGGWEQSFPVLQAQFEEHARICSAVLNPLRGFNIYNYVQSELKCVWLTVGMSLWIEHEVAQGNTRLQAMSSMNTQGMLGEFTNTAFSYFVQGFNKTSLPAGQFLEKSHFG